MDYDAIAARRELERAHAAAQKNFAMLARIREYLRTQQTDDNTPLSLDRAVCHPLLGGILRRDERGDVPGPSFTKNSLRLAAKKGDLETFWNGRCQYVTPAALRAWVTRKPDAAAATPVDPPRPPSLSPAALTLHEKRQGNASVSLALAALDSIKSPAPTVKKRRK
ncbi:hypothetical protein [Rhizobium giardinii]|uniref:hypothetical protein n=1 Tax=Rhizobium giardinii TaxID=56731 RepID=UPI003D6F7162